VNTFYTKSEANKKVSVTLLQAKGVRVVRGRDLSTHEHDERDFFFPAYRLDVFTGAML
jgi:hypothetical protein